MYCKYTMGVVWVYSKCTAADVQQMQYICTAGEKVMPLGRGLRGLRGWTTCSTVCLWGCTTQSPYAVRKICGYMAMLAHALMKCSMEPAPGAVAGLASPGAVPGLASPGAVAGLDSPGAVARLASPGAVAGLASPGLASPGL